MKKISIGKTWDNPYKGFISVVPTRSEVIIEIEDKTIKFFFWYEYCIAFQINEEELVVRENMVGNKYRSNGMGLALNLLDKGAKKKRLLVADFDKKIEELNVIDTNRYCPICDAALNS